MSKQIDSENLEDILTDFLVSPLKQIEPSVPQEEDDEFDEVVSLVNPPPQVDTSALRKEEYEVDDGSSKVALSDTERSILEYSLKGNSPDIIATRLGLPKSYVRGFLLKKETKDYLKELKEAKSQLLQLRALELYGGIIDARVEQIEENGGSLADLSRKDTVDIIRAAVELSSIIDKGSSDNTEKDIYINILQQVTK